MSEEQIEAAAEREMDIYRRQLDKAREQRDAACAERDKAYAERADLVAFIAAAHTDAVIAYETEDDEWPVVIIETRTGQLSWHIAKADLGAFSALGLPVITGEQRWDGHDTPEKYRRLAELTRLVGMTAPAWWAGVEGPPAPAADENLTQMSLTLPDTGYQGPAAHTFTAACDGFHPAGQQCNLPAREADGCECGSPTCRRGPAPGADEDDPAERADVLRTRREMAREAGDDRAGDQ